MQIQNAPITSPAVVFKSYGGPDELMMSSRVVRFPRAGELRVAVSGAGVNPADAALRAGRFRGVVRLRLPFTPGCDVAGSVEAVGYGVEEFTVGDRVVAMQPTSVGGAYATHVIVKAEHAAQAPGGSLETAAGLPLVGLTALQALRDKAALTAGQDLLVYGGSGGVGHLALQIGKIMGARVTAVTSRRHASFLTDLGIDDVVLRDQVDVTTTCASSFDVVFDAVGKLPWRSLRAMLRPNGIAVTVKPLIDKLVPDFLAWTRRGKRFRSVLVRPHGADLRELVGLVNEGRLRVSVEKAFSLQEAADAHRLIEQGHVAGKLVLTASSPPQSTTRCK